jgi:hypothetical protein
MIDAWSETVEEDDGSESWEAMLQKLDQDRESPRKLYPTCVLMLRSALRD